MDAILRKELEKKLDEIYRIKVDLNNLTEFCGLRIIASILFVYDNSWKVDSIPILIGKRAETKEEYEDNKKLLRLFFHNEIAALKRWIVLMGEGHHLIPGLNGCFSLTTDKKKFFFLISSLMAKTENLHGLTKLKAFIRGFIQKQARAPTKIKRSSSSTNVISVSSPQIIRGREISRTPNNKKISRSPFSKPLTPPTIRVESKKNFIPSGSSIPRTPIKKLPSPVQRMSPGFIKVLPSTPVIKTSSYLKKNPTNLILLPERSQIPRTPIKIDNNNGKNSEFNRMVVEIHDHHSEEKESELNRTYNLSDDSHFPVGISKSPETTTEATNEEPELFNRTFDDSSSHDVNEDEKESELNRTYNLSGDSPFFVGINKTATTKTIPNEDQKLRRKRNDEGTKREVGPYSSPTIIVTDESNIRKVALVPDDQIFELPQNFGNECRRKSSSEAIEKEVVLEAADNHTVWEESEHQPDADDANEEAEVTYKESIMTKKEEPNSSSPEKELIDNLKLVLGEDSGASESDECRSKLEQFTSTENKNEIKGIKASDFSEKFPGVVIEKDIEQKIPVENEVKNNTETQVRRSKRRTPKQKKQEEEKELGCKNKYQKSKRENVKVSNVNMKSNDNISKMIDKNEEITLAPLSLTQNGSQENKRSRRKPKMTMKTKAEKKVAEIIYDDEEVKKTGKHRGVTVQKNIKNKEEENSSKEKMKNEIPATQKMIENDSKGAKKPVKSRMKKEIIETKHDTVITIEKPKTKAKQKSFALEYGSDKGGAISKTIDEKEVNNKVSMPKEEKKFVEIIDDKGFDKSIEELGTKKTERVSQEGRNVVARKNAKNDVIKVIPEVEVGLKDSSNISEMKPSKGRRKKAVTESKDLPLAGKSETRSGNMNPKQRSKIPLKLMDGSSNDIKEVPVEVRMGDTNITEEIVKNRRIKATPENVKEKQPRSRRGGANKSKLSEIPLNKLGRNSSEEVSSSGILEDKAKVVESTECTKRPLRRSRRKKVEDVTETEKPGKKVRGTKEVKTSRGEQIQNADDLHDEEKPMREDIVTEKSKARRRGGTKVKADKSLSKVTKKCGTAEAKEEKEEEATISKVKLRRSAKENHQHRTN